MALSFSVILGISAAVGSIVPLVRLHPDAVFQKGGITVLCEVALVLIGVGIAAVAGRQREAAIKATTREHKVSVATGLLFATISGLGSALVNFGFAFGEPLKHAAQQLGTAPIWTPNPVWLPLMMAGGIPNLIYCIFLLRKNGTATRFASSGASGFYILTCSDHGVFLVWQYGDVRCGCYEIGRARSGPGLAAVHVADCDRGHALGSEHGRTERSGRATASIAQCWSYGAHHSDFCSWTL